MEKQQEALHAISEFPNMEPMFDYLKKYDKFNEYTPLLPPYIIMARVATDACGLR